jgi:hypothetical protein
MSKREGIPFLTLQKLLIGVFPCKCFTCLQLKTEARLIKPQNP